MALQSDIGGNGSLFVGEDKVIRLELIDSVGVPVDMGLFEILFDVRTKDSSVDPALLSKTATVSGIYNSSRVSNTQRASIALSDTEMNTLRAKTYRYSFKRMDDGSETVLVYGNFNVEKATAP